MPFKDQDLTAGQLVRTCEDTYASFDFSGGLTLDSHLEEKLQALGANEDEKCFISQVVYGMTRFKKFLSSFLDGFYHHNRYISALYCCTWHVGYMPVLPCMRWRTPEHCSGVITAMVSRHVTTPAGEPKAFRQQQLTY
eukprot:GHUV01033903.1.p1 GENE.GHUV01033903.1~~GHUV01033903.1.p1  ORF type:complete len:138 (-),score=17.44 GHUV01033903.1:191-604(-)